ncbi:MAG: CAP domain-containing protein [Pyrinomonadaceae bacterium]
MLGFAVFALVVTLAPAFCADRGASAHGAQPRPAAQHVVSVMFGNVSESNWVGGSAVSPAFLSDASIEERAFHLINEARRAHGLRILEWHADLHRMAQSHSGSMARDDFFSHIDPHGLGMLGRARRTGLAGWRALGENLAYNLGYSDPAAFAVHGWADSIKHRRNLLRPVFTHTAIGVARTLDGRFFFTQVFGSK